jgi:hypothetical protein
MLQLQSHNIEAIQLLSTILKHAIKSTYNFVATY